jgi:prepilin-type N-terminal cleavage/methylation domain-containing protein
MRLFSEKRIRATRGGFTLIELLVVIGIITVLVSLSAAAVIRYTTVQQINNTQTTINKVYAKLNTVYKAYKNKFWNEGIPQLSHDYILTNLANSPADPNAEYRVRVIWVKLRFKQTFPINFTEALNPGLVMSSPPGQVPGIQALPTYQNFLTNLGVPGTGTTPAAAYESSACLLMALQQGQSGVGVNAEDLAGGQSIGSFPLPSGQNIQAFVDAWGQPLTFARWPTNSTYINPNGATAGYNDPGDPQGLLASSSYLGSASATNFTSLPVHALPPSTAPGTSYYLIPVLVSNGPDKQLGLDPIALGVPPPGTSTASNDNIYSTTSP